MPHVDAVNWLSRLAVQHEEPSIAGKKHEAGRGRKNSRLASGIREIPYFLRGKGIHRTDVRAGRVTLLQSRQPLSCLRSGGAASEPPVTADAQRIVVRG